MAADLVLLHSYFDLLEDTNIFDHPSRIFNCDETGMPLNPTAAKVFDLE